MKTKEKSPEQSINYQFIGMPIKLTYLLNNNCRSLLFALIQLSSYYSNSEGYFFRTNLDLVEDTNLSQKLVIAAVDTLYSKGIIDVVSIGKSKGKQSNEYKIFFNKFEEYEKLDMIDLKNPKLKIEMVNYDNKGYKPSYLSKNLPQLPTKLLNNFREVSEEFPRSFREVSVVTNNINNINNIKNRNNIKEYIYNNILNNNIYRKIFDNILFKKNNFIFISNNLLNKNNFNNMIEEKNNIINSMECAANAAHSNINLKSFSFDLLKEKGDKEIDNNNISIEMPFFSDSSEDGALIEQSVVSITKVQENAGKQIIVKQANILIQRLGDIESKEELIEKSKMYVQWLEERKNRLTDDELFQSLMVKGEEIFVSTLSKIKELKVESNEEKIDDVIDAFFLPSSTSKKEVKEEVVPMFRITKTGELITLQEALKRRVSVYDIEEVKEYIKKEIDNSNASIEMPFSSDVSEDNTSIEQSVGTTTKVLENAGKQVSKIVPPSMVSTVVIAGKEIQLMDIVTSEPEEVVVFSLPL